ncbi:hypothetical protein MRX96_032830 [Rhipicephalus microplus]
MMTMRFCCGCVVHVRVTRMRKAARLNDLLLSVRLSREPVSCRILSCFAVKGLPAGSKDFPLIGITPNATTATNQRLYDQRCDVRMLGCRWCNERRISITPNGGFVRGNKHSTEGTGGDTASSCVWADSSPGNDVQGPASPWLALEEVCHP